jgi:hypothetical protein
MLEEIERLRTTVRYMWQERQAAGAGAPGTLTIRDTEIADRARVDLDTVRAFLISEDGSGIVVRADGGELSVGAVVAGYGA